MEKIYFVTVDLEVSIMSALDLDSLALNEHQSLGKVEFNIDEARVDEILGKDAYCGGEIPEQILEKIQKEMNKELEYKYFWSDKELANSFYKDILKRGLKATLEEGPLEDWNQTWRESFKTIEVSKNLSVVPSWEKEKEDSKKVFIYPGMGFGTGNHETTFLCLSLFEKIQSSFDSNSVALDFGCGSGILGIAAIKKSLMTVDFVDIDVDALDNCVMNLEHNDYNSYSEGHSLILRERFIVNRTYDLVFANILENVLLMEKEVLYSSLKDDGYLIVSGLLADQEDTILKEYSKLNHVETVTKGDWIALLFKGIKSN